MNKTIDCQALSLASTPFTYDNFYIMELPPERDKPDRLRVEIFGIDEPLAAHPMISFEGTRERLIELFTEIMDRLNV